MSISPARTAAFDILLRVQQQDAYASELLHSDRLVPLSPADRSLTTELVMGVLRWRSRLDETIRTASSLPLEKLDPEVLTALRLATYQLRYLSRIPAHAAINDSVELVKRKRKRSAAPFANAVLRKIAGEEPESPQESSECTATSLAREYAHPQWLVERWIAAFGMEDASAICQYDQQIPHTAVRLDSAEVGHEIVRDGIDLAPGALLANARIVVRGDVSRTQACGEGRVFIQDEASQLVASLVGSRSRILDCCAAPGGKTAAIARRNPAATIIAVELHANRAVQLRKRVRAANVQVIQADALNLPTLGGFDRVLADVPCSGTGTLARHPEIKWRLKPTDLGDFHRKQVAILIGAMRQLSEAGRLVYSTCSLEREEDEAVVEEVLHDTPGYRLRDCRDDLQQLLAGGELICKDLDSLLSGSFLRTMPGKQPCDGFFAAVIEKVR